ncbi:uncharacterized protein MYCFIDRAFT_170990 [Pseudocercospora fijiensis CIRAD86]|uniref:Uncharacterized protein n=1 Tax=Pseudocercospora fijiensis (strain CIRAD86) TaxID=383855 RepID=N1Q9J9_PSEFD|nr:uncharacterized protein MYCFIDRAFT_170990 [Pseudocercospora fijiensis CIRAD86]EME89549.1 hypothetical protein MYCFIDRAFT_170990 [Pseudocercospora fijiensis CIRAD86]
MLCHSNQLQWSKAGKNVKSVVIWDYMKCVVVGTLAGIIGRSGVKHQTRQTSPLKAAARALAAPMLPPFRSWMPQVLRAPMSSSNSLEIRDERQDSRIRLDLRTFPSFISFKAFPEEYGRRARRFMLACLNIGK